MHTHGVGARERCRDRHWFSFSGWLFLPVTRLSVCPPLGLSPQCPELVEQERGSPASCAGQSLTYLCPVHYCQAAGEAQDDQPQVSHGACLPLGGSASGPRVFMGLEPAGSPSWQLPTEDPFPLLLPLTLPRGWPHSRQYTWSQETAAISSRAQIGPRSCRQACMGTHTRQQQRSSFPTAGCSQVPQCPQCTCADYCLLGSKQVAQGRGCKRGWAHGALCSGSRTRPWFHPQRSGHALSPCPACPPHLQVNRRSLSGTGHMTSVTEMT